MGKYALLIVGTMTFALITFSNSVRQNLYQSELEKVEMYNINQAKNIAQSVAIAVISKINDSADNDYDVGLNQTTNYPGAGSFEAWNEMGGSFNVQLRNEGDSLLYLTTIGRAEGYDYTQNVMLRPNQPIWNPNLTYAVFSGTAISLSGSARLIGHAGTNATGVGDVTLAWSTSIDSSLLIGPGGNPLTTVIQSNFIDGNVGLEIGALPSPGEYELPEYIDYPGYILPLPSVSMNWSNTGTTLSPAYYDGNYIESINIPGNYTLNIDTGTEDRTLYVGDLNISQGHLNVTGTGNLTIIAENDLTVSGSSTVNNNTQDSERVMLYYGGSDPVDLAGATMFYGSIYAETADVNIGGSGGIQGHIITGGSNVTVSGAADAQTRVLYAPNAHVNVTGSGRVSGAVIADRFTASGAAVIDFSSAMSSTLPQLQLASDGSGSGHTILSWY